MVGSRMLLKGFESGLFSAVSVVVSSRAGERRAQIKEICGSHCAVLRVSVKRTSTRPSIIANPTGLYRESSRGSLVSSGLILKPLSTCHTTLMHTF